MISDKNVFRFGLDDKEVVVKLLREFADKIDDDKILIQKIQAGQIVEGSEYFKQAILIEFVEAESEPS